MANDFIKRLYPDSYQEILVKLKRPKSKSKLPKKTPNWYKQMQLYVAYPDAFIEDGKADLNTLKSKIPYLKKLGVNALHILPFFKSPILVMSPSLFPSTLIFCPTYNKLTAKL